MLTKAAMEDMEDQLKAQLAVLVAEGVSSWSFEGSAVLVELQEMRT